eukprot:COSAG04_NODE_533_length_12959_cov_8.218497_9_plen_310_part_00
MNRVGFQGTDETQPSRMMYLDSFDATQLTQFTSHYTYSFKDAVETSDGEGMLVSLSSASIPYSFYNIRAGVNDKLYYEVNDEDPVITSATIPEGNYNATTLGTEITKALSSASISMEIQYHRTRQKYKFKCTSHTLTLKFPENSLMFEIGFDSSDTLMHQGDWYEAPNVADLNGSVHAIYIRTNLATRSVMESQTGGVSDILAKIDINSDPGGVITLEPQQVSHEALIHTAGVKSVEIRITDERNRLLNLNGLHSQIGLRFRFVNIKMAAPIVYPGESRQRVAPQDVQKALEKKQARRKTKPKVKKKQK